ncbi:lysoplasmalogenase isoform X2 [Maniola jurtina]|uniref:lysoplasmalogenase isoform X2 n=1 Tax=Maniola jurtina TaxID=191418 RepID=UPI001E68DBBA|nr:lysoplasmalogenase isoform X2 [Maniola jurtina]
MISPSDLWVQLKSLGRGARLVPFYKAVCVYFVAGGGAPSPSAAALKCAPVLCLLLCVLLATRAAAGYARRVCAGLALSALGDALLVWPQHFVAGMAAFAAAHVAYICAFGLRPRRALLGAALLGGALAYARLVPAPGALRPLVPAYALLLSAMAWRGAARPGAQRAGALLFLLSDAILGYSLFAEPLPHAQVLVMSTYYLGQLGIALSALEPRVRHQRAAH